MKKIIIRITGKILFIFELMAAIFLISNVVFAKYIYSFTTQISIPGLEQESNLEVFAKIFDTDNDEIGDTLVLNSSIDFDYNGTLVNDYDNVNNNEYQDGSNPIWKKDINNIKEVVFLSEIKPVTTNGWFNHATNLRTITNIENLNTCLTTNMDIMFYNCRYLKSIDVSNFNTSKVTSMKKMFSNCFYLNNLDLSSFDTSSVINMREMFYNSYKIKKIYVSDSFVVDQVTESNNMFKQCKAIVGESGEKYNDSLTDKQMANYNTGYFTHKENDNTILISEFKDSNIGSIDEGEVQGIKKNNTEILRNTSINTVNQTKETNSMNSKANLNEENIDSNDNIKDLENEDKINIIEDQEYQDESNQIMKLPRTGM